MLEFLEQRFNDALTFFVRTKSCGSLLFDGILKPIF
jgi:hypothetical protein